MNGRYVLYSGIAGGQEERRLAFGQLTCWQARRWWPFPLGVKADRMGYLKNWVYFLCWGESPYRVYRLVDGGQTLSQCIVTTATPRFPFMSSGDWQIGLVHTPERFRRKGFGQALIRAVLGDLAGGARCWWLAEVSNHASRRLAESVGLVHVGEAIRQVGPVGGRFVVADARQDVFERR